MPTLSEFAMTGLTPGWGQERSCPLQTEPLARHTLLFQHAEKGEHSTPATGVHVSPPQDNPSFFTSHDTATHIRNIHTALQGLYKNNQFYYHKWEADNRDDSSAVLWQLNGEDSSSHCSLVSVSLMKKKKKSTKQGNKEKQWQQIN